MQLTANFPGELPRDWSPVWKRLRLLLFADLRENFQGGHAPDGTPWRPLAFKRPRGKGAGKPLLDKGMLRASMTTASAPGHVQDMGPLHLEMGTNLEYAWLQQEGGRVRPKSAKMLALPLSREAVNYPRPKGFPCKLFLHRTGKIGGKVFLAETKGKGKLAKLVFHYLLLPSVTVPARPFAGFSPSFAECADEVLADYVQEWLEGKG